MVVVVKENHGDGGAEILVPQRPRSQDRGYNAFIIILILLVIVVVEVIVLVVVVRLLSLGGGDGK